jgi:hypothetical protein
LVYLAVVWYFLWPFWWILGSFGILPRFGTLCQEKSGSPGFSLKILKPSHLSIYAGNFDLTKLSCYESKAPGFAPQPWQPLKKLSRM